MTTRWLRASSGCTRPRSPATWGRGKPPPGSRPPPANGPAGTTPRGSCGAPGAARRANTSRPGATGRSARSPPAARAAGPAGHQKEAAMAAAHYPGGLRPHPPGLRPGPRPSSEMPPEVTAGPPAAGHLLAGRGTGAAEPPPRSRAPPASQAMPLRVTLDQPGEPAVQCGVPDEEMPKPPGSSLAGAARHQAGSWTAQLDRCSIKQKRKMIRPWFRQAAVPWKTTATQTRASGENRVSTKLGVIQTGDVVVFCKVVAVAPARVRRRGQVQAQGTPVIMRRSGCWRSGWMPRLGRG